MKTLIARRTVVAALVAALFGLFSYARLVAQVEDPAPVVAADAAEGLHPAGELEDAVALTETDAVVGGSVVGDDAAAAMVADDMAASGEGEVPAGGVGDEEFFAIDEDAADDGFFTETEGMLPSEEPSNLEISDTGNVTIDFVDADIKDVLRAFSFKTGINVVAGDEVTGSVTIRLTNVPWEQALQLILEAKSYAYVKEGNVVKVLTQEAMQNEPIEISILRLRYAKAGDIAPTVENILKDRERGSVQFDERSNSLIVADVRSNMDKITEIVDILDAQTPQVSIEAKIVETSDERVKQLGINWTSLAAYTVRAGNLERSYEEVRTDAKIGSSGVVDLGVDSSSRSRLASSDEFASRSFGSTRSADDLGSTYSSSNSSSGGETSSRAYGSSALTSATTVAGNVRGTGVTEVGYDAEKGELTMESVVDSLITDTRTAVLSASDFAVVLSALQQDSDVELVSNPNIVVSDNQEASITIGEEYPIPQYQFNEDTATLEVSGFDYKEIGVILRVTPHINPEGYVTLDVEPEVSSRGAAVMFGGSVGTEIPIINTRRARSRVIVKDGYTLTIGGLVTQDENNTHTKVPVLGDVPLLGRMFRHESLEKVTRNVIIFLTTNLVDPDSGTPTRMTEVEAAGAEYMRADVAEPTEAVEPIQPVPVVEAVPMVVVPAEPVLEPVEPVVDPVPVVVEPVVVEPVVVEPVVVEPVVVEPPSAVDGDRAVPAGRVFRGNIGGVRR